MAFNRHGCARFGPARGHCLNAGHSALLLAVAGLVLVLGLGLGLGFGVKQAVAENLTEVADVHTTDAWVRAPAVPGRTSAAFFTLVNQGDAAIRLVDVTTPAAGMTEIHETTTDSQGRMKMAPHGPITVAAGDSVTLAPGGLHVMLMKTAAAVKPGGRVTLHLTLGDGRSFATAAQVVPPGETLDADTP